VSNKLNSNSAIILVIRPTSVMARINYLNLIFAFVFESSLSVNHSVAR